MPLYLFIFLICHFKSGLVKTIYEASYNLIPGKDALYVIVIPFTILIGNCFSPDCIDRHPISEAGERKTREDVKDEKGMWVEVDEEEAHDMNKYSGKIIWFGPFSYKKQILLWFISCG